MALNIPLVSKTFRLFVFLIGISFVFDVFACQVEISKLANSDIVRFGGYSTNKSALQRMLNIFLDRLPSGHPRQLQVSFPAFIKYNPNQAEQFGDGQKNALSDFGSIESPPFIAILDRAMGDNQTPSLYFILSDILPGIEAVDSIEVVLPNEKKIVDLKDHTSGKIEINLNELGWNQLLTAKTLFFRPLGWSDWFFVSFPQAYLPIQKLQEGIHEKSIVLPSGESFIDPLSIGTAENIQEALRFIEVGEELGFQLARVQRSQRVHGVYLDSEGPQTLTSTGGVWTRYRIGDPFKIIYLVKDPRVVDIEEEEGVVSGTGPHYIGATGEVILNSLSPNELMTLYGISAPTVGPDGQKIAWGFSHQWIGTWLKPGWAFVAPQGSFHWHVNHLEDVVGAQVLTPPEVPNSNNFFGFPKRVSQE